jgi:WD40 repeat protein
MKPPLCVAIPKNCQICCMKISFIWIFLQRRKRHFTVHVCHTVVSGSFASTCEIFLLLTSQCVAKAAQHIITSSSYPSLFFPFFFRRHICITFFFVDTYTLQQQKRSSQPTHHILMSHEPTTKKPRLVHNHLHYDDLVILSVCSFVSHRPTLNNVSLVSKRFKELVEKVETLQDKPWPIARNVRFGYSSHVFCVAFAPTRSTFATGGRDGSLRIWTAHSGKFTSLRMLLPTTGPPRVPFIRAISFSLDGKYVASALDDGSIRLWLVPQPATIHDCIQDPVAPLFFHVLPIHVGPPMYGGNPHPPAMTIAFSPTEDFLVAGYSDGSLLLFDVETRQSFRRLSAESITISGINSVSFSTDGLTLAVATTQFDSVGVDSGATLFWSFPQGLSLTTNPTFRFNDWGDGTVSSVAASSTSQPLPTQYFASGSEHGKVWLWNQDSSSISLINSMHSHTSVVRSLAFSPDSKLLASASDDGSIMLWKVPCGRCVHVFQAAAGSKFTSVSFSPKGRVLVSAATGDSADDGTIAMWDCSDVAIHNSP